MKTYLVRAAVECPGSGKQKRVSTLYGFRIEAIGMPEAESSAGDRILEIHADRRKVRAKVRLSELDGSGAIVHEYEFDLDYTRPRRQERMRYNHFTTVLRYRNRPGEDELEITVTITPGHPIMLYRLRRAGPIWEQSVNEFLSHVQCLFDIRTYCEGGSQSGLYKFLCRIAQMSGTKIAPGNNYFIAKPYGDVSDPFGCSSCGLTARVSMWRGDRSGWPRGQAPARFITFCLSCQEQVADHIAEMRPLAEELRRQRLAGTLLNPEVSLFFS